MTPEKLLEISRDCADSVRENTYLSIAQDVEHVLGRQIELASNEVCAAIAWEAFFDGCDGYDVPATIEEFAVHFPRYAELV